MAIDYRLRISLPKATQHQRGRLALLALVILSGIGALRIASTYHVFSQTTDEPITITTGLEWLKAGTYELDRGHPPLARIAAGLGAYFEGLNLPSRSNSVFGECNHFGVGTCWPSEILHEKGRYLHNLAVARLGVLPFFLLATYVVWQWSLKVFDLNVAIMAVLLFTMLPAVLAHAGLATTDMASAATMSASLLAFVYWLDQPSYARSIVLGLTSSLALLSKYTTLLFLPVCGLAILGCGWRARRNATRTETDRHHRATAIGLAAVTAFLIFWGAYHFSLEVERIHRPHPTIDQLVGRNKTIRQIAYFVRQSVPLPAPEFVKGVDQQRVHNGEGHVSYLLGEVRDDGWWYFFPVVLATKTPLAFLILSATGFVLLLRQGWRYGEWKALTAAAAAACILVVSMRSRVDLGIRLILPIYPFLAVVAGYGAVRIWQLRRPRWLGAIMMCVLVLWQIMASARAHPDYLAYFNELAGHHPEWIAVDSDLDWGQDLLRLADTLHSRKIDSVAIAYAGTAELGRFNMPAMHPLLPYQPTSGWIAISELKLRTGERKRPYHGYAWLYAYQPIATVGRSIQLYYVTDQASKPTPDVSANSQTGHTDWP